MEARIPQLVLILCTSFFASCTTVPQISDYPPLTELPHDYRVNWIPLIVVGQVLDGTRIGPPRRSEWDTTVSVQLNKVTIRVENVLKGSLAADKIDVYFFLDTTLTEGPAKLGLSRLGGTWRIGDREMFFLQTNAGVVRTVCDNWRHCVLPVLSGEHPQFKRNPERPITESIVDVLLTRGRNCSDKEMVEAIVKDAGPAYDFSKEYAVTKLQQLAANETLPVREEACNALASLDHACTVSKRESRP